MWRGTGCAGPRPLLLDGAMGTELIARGLDLAHEAPELWVLQRPDVIREIHGAYIQAGAEILQTCTFGATRPRLLHVGLGDEVVGINRAAVALVRAEARNRPIWASLGPTGIDPFATDARSRIAAAYREQLAALVEAGVDGVHFETMYHPIEVAEAVAAARATAYSLPTIVSATYALGDHGFQTPLGVPLATMTRAIQAAAPDAIGINCSLEARKMVGLVRQLRSLVDLPLVVQPQGGPAEVECRGPRRTDDVAEFLRGVRALLELGEVDIIGGCCGAGPAHIATLAAELGR